MYVEAAAELGSSCQPTCFLHYLCPKITEIIFWDETILVENRSRIYFILRLLPRLHGGGASAAYSKRDHPKPLFSRNDVVCYVAYAHLFGGLCGAVSA